MHRWVSRPLAAAAVPIRPLHLVPFPLHHLHPLRFSLSLSSFHTRARSSSISTSRDLFCRHVGHGHSHGPVPVRARSSKSKNQKTSKEESQYKEKMLQDSNRITMAGLYSNIGLLVLKIFGGIYGHSTALLADAAHSLSDLVTDSITLLSIKFSQKPTDKVHPYGFGKYESMGTFGIGTVLLATGAGIGWEAIEAIQVILRGEALELPTNVALVAAVISIIVKEALYWSTLRVARQYDSSVLRANAWHHRSDAVSTMVALVGVVGSMVSMPYLDPIAGVMVAGMIVKAGAELVWDSFKDLTDRAMDDRMMKAVAAIIESTKSEGVLGYHELRGRRMGSFYLVDVHIEVDPHLSVSAAHQIAERVRIKILENQPQVNEVLVHVDTRQIAREHHDDDEHDNLESLMRPQEEIEKDVRRVLIPYKRKGQILGLTHFTCHFLDHRVTVQLEIVMDSELRISEARNIAAQLQHDIIQQVPDVKWADIHLELNPRHISEAVDPATSAQKIQPTTGAPKEDQSVDSASAVVSEHQHDHHHDHDHDHDHDHEHEHEHEHDHNHPPRDHQHRQDISSPPSSSSNSRS